MHSTLFFFFFSSRRRHTRLQGDWSSDVCSSDLSAERLDQFVKRGAEAFVADAKDAAALASAFAGARAVYALIPPDPMAQDYRAEQETVSDALAAALDEAGVTHTVVLSSLGAEHASGTGPIAGLHSLEQKLN